MELDITVAKNVSVVMAADGRGRRENTGRTRGWACVAGTDARDEDVPIKRKSWETAMSCCEAWVVGIKVEVQS